MNLTPWWSECTRPNPNDYVGEHGAPDKSNGAPMHNLTGIYPEDFYSMSGAHYYGEDDAGTTSIVQAAKGRPRSQIKVYRAVPHTPSTEERVAATEAEMRHILRTKVNHRKPGEYDRLWNEVERLKRLPPSTPRAKLKINPGDWVTISRAYAVEHGVSNLNGNYRVVSKTVPAKHLYTDGNSIYEWGYDPSVAG